MKSPTYLLSAEEASTGVDKTIGRHTNERGKTVPKACGKLLPEDLHHRYMLGMHPPKHETTYLYNNNCNFYSAFFSLNMIKCTLQFDKKIENKCNLQAVKIENEY